MTKGDNIGNARLIWMFNVTVLAVRDSVSHIYSKLVESRALELILRV